MGLIRRENSLHHNPWVVGSSPTAAIPPNLTLIQYDISNIQPEAIEYTFFVRAEISQGGAEVSSLTKFNQKIFDFERNFQISMNVDWDKS